MRFWDCSAVVALLVAEATTQDRIRLLESDSSMVVWWATSVECASSIQRLARERSLNADGAAAATRRLRELELSWMEVEPSQNVRQQAERLLRLHPLRASDALQLAAALIACDHDPDSLEIVTSDARMAAAAELEGFTVR